MILNYAAFKLVRLNGKIINKLAKGKNEIPNGKNAAVT